MYSHAASRARASTVRSLALPKLRQLQHFPVPPKHVHRPPPMPPWVAFAPRSTTSLIKSRLNERIPATLLHRHAIPRTRCANLRVRSASTHVSPTAINLRPNIPPRNKDLHDALSALSGVAETYANISRLQLALSGLAVEDGVTRIAVLGLNSQLSAQRLVRLLLADPLGKEEGWERELEKTGEGSERAVLVK